MKDKSLSILIQESYISLNKGSVGDDVFPAQNRQLRNNLKKASIFSVGLGGGYYGSKAGEDLFGDNGASDAVGLIGGLAGAGATNYLLTKQLSGNDPRKQMLVMGAEFVPSLIGAGVGSAMSNDFSGTANGELVGAGIGAGLGYGLTKSIEKKLQQKQQR